PPGLTITEISSFDENIDELWASISKDRHISIVRNKEYLNWRYVSNPGEYVIYAAKRKDLLAGYIILKCEKGTSGLKLGNIVDIFAAKNQITLIQTLVLRAIEYFRQEKIDVVFSWVIKSSELYRALNELGFISYYKKLHFAIRTIRIEYSDLIQLKNPAAWYFTMGDADGI
ncbi:unnamed protein product, partial [marine sediment metagenome]